MIFVYPLHHEAYGLAQYFITCCLLLYPFASLGLDNVIINFFSDFKGKDNKHMLPTVLLLSVGCIILFIPLYLVFGRFIYQLFESIGLSTEILQEQQWSVIFLMMLIVWTNIVINYISNYQKVAVPTVIRDLGFKVYLPLSILVVYMDILKVEDVIYILMGYYTIALVLLFIYMKQQSILSFKVERTIIDKLTTRPVIKYSLLTAVTGLGSLLAFRIDSFMITGLLSPESNGLYFNILVMTSVIDIPGAAIGKVAGPIISKSWTEKDTEQIQGIYTKSSIVNQVVGSLIFLGIWINIENIFAISSNPSVFIGASSIFLVLGLAKLFDGFMGVNSHIIAYSKYYRYNLYFVLILGVLNIATNLYFIPRYGIIGAAYSTLFSLVIFNFLKFIFIQLRMGLSPFTTKNLTLLILTAGIGAVGFFAPHLGNSYLDIIAKSTLVVALYVPLVYFLHISEDINKLVDSSVLKARSIIHFKK